VIDACVSLLGSTNADAVVTVLSVPPKYNPHWVYFQDGAGLLRLSTGEAAPLPRRQELPPAFHREGSVYVTRSNILMECNSLYGKRLVGYPLEQKHSVNIDGLEDWDRAEMLVSAMRR